MYTAQKVLQCVSQATLSVSSCVCFVAGALRRIHAEALLPPDLRGGSPQPPHQPLGPTSWAPVQRESRTIRPISLAFLEVQQTVGRQSTRATPVDRPAVSPSRPPRRASALLNASGASESTAAGSLKACLIKRRRC